MNMSSAGSVTLQECEELKQCLANLFFLAGGLRCLVMLYIEKPREDCSLTICSQSIWRILGYFTRNLVMNGISVYEPSHLNCQRVGKISNQRR
jgi:hypothetical protein